MLFREASIQGRLVNLRAANDLGRYVRARLGPAADDAASRRTARCCVSKGKGPIPSTHDLHLIEVGRAEAEAGRAVRAVRPAGAADRAGRARGPVPHAAALAGRDRERRRRRSRARPELADVLPRRTRWFAAGRARRRAPVGRRRVQPARSQRLTAELEASSDEFQVTAPTDTLSTAASVVDGRRAPPAAPRRRGRRAAARVHDPRRRRAAPRRDGRAPPAHLVRRAALAGRAAHARRVGARRGRRHGRRLGAGRRGRRARRVARGLAGRRGRRARAALGRRARWPRRVVARGGRCCSTRRCARPRCSSGGSRSRRSTSRRSARSRSCSSAGRAARSTRSQLAGGGGTSAFLLLVPGADRVRRRGRRRAAPRAHAARARPRRSPRADLAAARRRVARAQSRATQRSPRRSSSRASASRCSPSPTARRSCRASATRPRYAVPALVRAHRGPRRSSSRCCTARRTLPATPTPVDAPLRATSRRGRPSASSRCPAAALPGVGGWRSDFASRRSPQLAPASSQPSRRDAAHAGAPAGRRFTLPVRRPATTSAIRAFFRSRSATTSPVSLGNTTARTARRAARRASRSGTRRSRSSSSTSSNSGRSPRTPARASSRAPRERSPSARRASTARRCRGALRALDRHRRGRRRAARRVGYVLTPDRTAIFRPQQPTDGRPLPVLVTPSDRRRRRPARDHPARHRGRAGRRRASSASCSASRRSSATQSIADLTQAGDAARHALAGPRHADELWLARHDARRTTPQLTGHVARRTRSRDLRVRPARARRAADARRHRGGRAAARAARPRARGRRRRPRRPRRALRPRGAGRVAGDDPRAPAAAQRCSSPRSASSAGSLLGAILSRARASRSSR